MTVCLNSTLIFTYSCVQAADNGNPEMGAGNFFVLFYPASLDAMLIVEYEDDEEDDANSSELFFSDLPSLVQKVKVTLGRYEPEEEETSVPKTEVCPNASMSSMLYCSQCS